MEDSPRKCGVTTHNKLLYSSIQLHRAFVRTTIMQLLVKTWLRHSELGIRAVRLFFTRCCIHPTNKGIEIPLMASRTMLEALWMFLISEDNDLQVHVINHLLSTGKQQPRYLTHAKTYDNVASPKLARNSPTQSISTAARSHTDRPPSGLASRGSAQTLARKSTKLAAAAR